MPRQRPGNTARGQKLGAGDGRTVGLTLLRLVPHPSQRVLEYGQLVRIPCDDIDHLIDDLRCNITAENASRSRDGLLKLITAEAGRQVLGVIDGVRQLKKAGAIPEEVRAHGDGDVNRRLRRPVRGEQQVHKGVCLISLRRPTFAVPKDLLELIDEYE